jgi:hypothetical protein
MCARCAPRLVLLALLPCVWRQVAQQSTDIFHRAITYRHGDERLEETIMTFDEAKRTFQEALRVARTPAPATRPCDLYSVAEAAAMARMDKRSVWRLIRTGKLRAYGWRGALRVSIDDLLKEYVPTSSRRE